MRESVQLETIILARLLVCVWAGNKLSTLLIYKEVMFLKRNLHAGKRMSGGFSVNVFTDDELYEIHLATLEVLEKTGVFVQDEEPARSSMGVGPSSTGEETS